MERAKFTPTTETDVRRLQSALNQARLSLLSIGHPEPLTPPDAKVCALMAQGALTRIDNALAGG